MDVYLRATAIILTVMGISLARAQSPAPEPQQRTQQENWQHTPSGQMGKEEPSAHAPAAKPLANAPLVNGSLAVPGAPENTDTVPARFSERNAADDSPRAAARRVRRAQRQSAGRTCRSADRN